MIILLWVLTAIAVLLIVGSFVFFAWYCSTNGGEGY